MDESGSCRLAKIESLRRRKPDNLPTAAIRRIQIHDHKNSLLRTRRALLAAMVGAVCAKKPGCATQIFRLTYKSSKLKYEAVVNS